MITYHQVVGVDTTAIAFEDLRVGTMFVLFPTATYCLVKATPRKYHKVNSTERFRFRDRDRLVYRVIPQSGQLVHCL